MFGVSIIYILTISTCSKWREYNENSSMEHVKYLGVNFKSNPLDICVDQIGKVCIGTKDLIIDLQNVLQRVSKIKIKDKDKYQWFNYIMEKKSQTKFIMENLLKISITIKMKEVRNKELIFESTGETFIELLELIYELLKLSIALLMYRSTAKTILEEIKNF